MNVIPETMELIQLGAGAVVLVLAVMVTMSGLARLIDKVFWR